MSQQSKPVLSTGVIAIKNGIFKDWIKELQIARLKKLQTKKKKTKKAEVSTAASEVIKDMKGED